MGSLRIEEVNIETVNTCTRKCPYCKFGLDRKWEPRVMDREVFEKILSDLRAAGYDGLIGPFVNNEPLMDKRMASFIGMITRELPSARSYLFTNGDLLDRERLHGLFERDCTRYSYPSILPRGVHFSTSSSRHSARTG
ncbi:MAG: radical SAM protein [Comamonadaceae bacterium]|nr:radical SAM protein [Comamonadaceae bacterium]